MVEATSTFSQHLPASTFHEQQLQAFRLRLLTLSMLRTTCMLRHRVRHVCKSKRGVRADKSVQKRFVRKLKTKVCPNRSKSARPYSHVSNASSYVAVTDGDPLPTYSLKKTIATLVSQGVAIINPVFHGDVSVSETTKTSFGDYQYLSLIHI